MSEFIVELATEQFSSIVQLKLQQKQSKLRGRVMEGFHVGQTASPIQYIGALQAKAPVGRFSPLSHNESDFTRRWVTPIDKDVGPSMIDSFDKLKTIVDPTSQYSDVHAAAVSREHDDRVIAAAFGTAQIGNNVNGSFTSETWASFSAAYTIANNFGSSAASGLTVAKMIEAKRLFRKAQVDVETEGLTWITNSQGESDLLKQAQVTSVDFNDKPVLVNGVVTRFMGFDIVYSERLAVISGPYRQNIALCKSGAYLGIWQDMKSFVDQRVDLSGRPWQIYTTMSCGATRLEPGRLLEVDCSDASTAADVTP